MNVTHRKYKLVVRGVFGRNRKVKFDTFDLVKRVPVDEPAKTVDDLRPLAMAKLAEIKAKTGCRYSVEEDPIEVKKHDVGDRFLETESYELFSGRTLLKGVVGGEEEVLVPMVGEVSL